MPFIGVSGATFSQPGSGRISQPSSHCDDIGGGVAFMSHDAESSAVLPVTSSRRRLLTKQGMSVPEKNAVAAIVLRKRSHLQIFGKLTRVDKCKARKKVRTWLLRHLDRIKKGGTVKLKSGSSLHCTSLPMFLDNQNELRDKLLYDLAMSDDADEDMVGAASHRWFQAVGESPLGKPPSASAGSKKAGDIIRMHMLLLTWHGDFGASGVDTASFRQLEMVDLERAICDHPAVKMAWDVLRNELLALNDRFGFGGLAFALEICTRTWLDTHSLKLHVHGWILQGPRRARMSISDLALTSASTPHFSVYGQSARRGMSMFAGCFYCTCKKAGQLFIESTKEAHVDYGVKADWILRLYSAGKISFAEAQNHLVRQVHGVKQIMADLEYAKQFLEARDEDVRISNVLDTLRKIEKPFRVIPEVSVWATQYDPLVPLDRYRFLVLDGPSRTGKTRFVQGALVKNPSQACILDCADAIVPPLKGNFCRNKHSLVMFDEAHAAMIIRCKKLFQASVNRTTYGSSATNIFVHTVWMHGIQLVVGSNVWAAEVANLDKPDQEWISQNSVYIHVDQPLWID